MTVIALDPGPKESAWLTYVVSNYRPIATFSTEPNDDVLGWLERRGRAGRGSDELAIEMVSHYGSGMSVGREVFDTVFWAGRFAQAWGGKFTLVYRPDVKLCLCGQRNAKDGNVRQALIDRFGGSKEAAIGRKTTPGPLYGISKHVWSALAVAVAYAEQSGFAPAPTGVAEHG